MDRSPPLRTAVDGIAAGLLATVAMSAVMLAARRAGVTPELPPAVIADEAVGAATGRPPTQAEEELIATVAHLGFGALAGVGLSVLYRVAGRPGVAGSTVLGLGYAASVYLVSYQGWVPALRILPPASRDDPGRVGTMVAAHAVYGAVAGITVGALGRR